MMKPFVKTMNGILETSREWIGIIIFEEWQTSHCDNNKAYYCLRN